MNYFSFFWIFLQRLFQRRIEIRSTTLSLITGIRFCWFYAREMDGWMYCWWADSFKRNICPEFLCMTAWVICATGCTDFESTTVNLVPEFQSRALNENDVNSQYTGFQGVIKTWRSGRSTILLVLWSSSPQLVERADVVCMCLYLPFCMHCETKFKKKGKQRKTVIKKTTGICRPLHCFCVYSLDFWYLPLTHLSELFTWQSDWRAKKVCSCCWTVQKWEFLKACAVTTKIWCCWQTFLKWRPATLQDVVL